MFLLFSRWALQLLFFFFLFSSSRISFTNSNFGFFSFTELPTCTHSVSSAGCHQLNGFSLRELFFLVFSFIIIFWHIQRKIFPSRIEGRQHTEKKNDKNKSINEENGNRVESLLLIHLLGELPSKKSVCSSIFRSRNSSSPKRPHRPGMFSHTKTFIALAPENRFYLFILHEALLLKDF